MGKWIWVFIVAIILGGGFGWVWRSGLLPGLTGTVPIKSPSQFTITGRAKVVALVKAMSPQAADHLLLSLNPLLAATVLSAMPQKQAAALLSAMPANTAARLLVDIGLRSAK